MSPEPGALAGAAEAVTALYEAHALGLIRLAVVMLGDRPAAEDVVQEAFYGLYRRWHALSDTANALAYVRSSVINGCRSALRRRVRQLTFAGADQPGEADSAESEALLGEEHRQVLLAIRRLPARQREALVLRYYLDLDEGEIASSMQVSRGTVKSTTSRARRARANPRGTIMNTLQIEDRIRAATRAVADTVAPNSVPPLRLPADRLLRARSGSLASVWGRWLAPMAAAAAVVAVAVAMVTVGRTANRAPVGSGGVPSARPGPVRMGPPISSYVASGRVPRYYVSIESHGNPNSHPSYAVVRATSTGAALETVVPAAAGPSWR